MTLIEAIYIYKIEDMKGFFIHANGEYDHLHLGVAIRADAVDVVCHIVDNNVIYECDIQQMRRMAIDRGVHRVTKLMDTYLKGGSWTSSEKEKERKTKKIKTGRIENILLYVGHVGLLSGETGVIVF